MENQPPTVENVSMNTNHENRFAIAQDPTRRYLCAEYEISIERQEQIFKQNPWCQVIVMPSGQVIERL